MDETVRAALASEPIMAVRREGGEGARRIANMETLLADALRDLPPAERQHAAAMTAVLCSSMTLRTFMDLTGTNAEQAAETVIWAIGRIIGRELEPRTRGKGKARR